MTISCDTTDTACTARAEDVANWTKTYHEERDKYIRAYRNYLEKALKGETATTEKETMQTAHDVITDHLKDLSDNNDLNNQTLSDRANEVKASETRVQRNNTNIKNQDNNIHKLNISLLSKERQIEYTNERNRNRRIMVAVLIIINLILIFVAYMLYHK